MQLTQPKPRFPKGHVSDPTTLAAGRYGTMEMVEIWGPEKTFEYSLRCQGQAALTLSRLYPDIIPYDIAEEINTKANLNYVKPGRIRYWEEKTNHDVIAINKALEEVLSPDAKSYVNLAKTSADTTQPAKALQIKDSLNVIADSVENLRDIVLEKSKSWIDIPFMCQSHLYDALPISAGRPFSHYGEMLDSDLKVLKFVYDNSIKGKWADATGDHHSAVTLGIDGIKLQREYCEDLGIGFTDAPAQIPGLEYEADIFYVMARTGETINNLAKFIAKGRGSDPAVFHINKPRKDKGSSTMPHKDLYGGNPTAEEQNMSVRNYTMGNMTTALANCRLPYARNLAASSNSRINLEDGFKYFDHGVRRLSNVVFWLGIDEERSKERISRTYGVTTSQNVMNYLVDPRKVSDPMPRSEAHDLLGELATKSFKEKINFVDVLLQSKDVVGRIDEKTLREITNPFKNLGESKNIVNTIYEKYHGKKTL